MLYVSQSLSKSPGSAPTPAGEGADVIIRSIPLCLTVSRENR